MFYVSLIFSGLIVASLLIIPGYVVLETSKSFHRIFISKDKSLYIWDIQIVVISAMTIIFCIFVIYLLDNVDISPENFNLNKFIVYSSIYPFIIFIYLFLTYLWYYNKIYKTKSDLNTEIKERFIPKFKNFKNFLFTTLLFSILYIIFIWFGWLINGFGQALG